jgi:hypothetical protein
MKAFTRPVPPLVIIGGVLLALASIQTVHAAGYGSAASEPRSAGAQRSQVVLLRGIYLYREQIANDAQFDQALGVPGIDGMAVVLDRSTIQPLRESFRTETIDSQLKLARQHNLPVELVVRAGRSVPACVAPDAQLKLGYAPHAGLGACSAVNMPPPWDTTYQSAFADIMQRTADYVRGQGIAISVVKLTGINATTEELRLSAEREDSTENCPGGPVDDVAVWRTARYTPTKLAQAFDRLASSFAKYFPDTPVTVALIPRRGFPPINDAQQIVRGQQIRVLNDRVLQSLVSSGAPSLPGRFILQFDFLMYGQLANAEVVDLARANGLYLARQTNLWRGNVRQGAACGGSGPRKGTVCTDDQYLGLLEEGIHPAGGQGLNAKGLYIEVFAYDALAHKDVIEKAHQELVGTN